MATLNPTIVSATIVDADAVSNIHIAHVLFTVTGTYDQSASESLEVLAVPTAIQNSLRNGKTVTLQSAGSGLAGLIGTQEYHCEDVVVSGTQINCTLFKSDIAAGAEHADAVIGTYNRPNSLYVAITQT